MTVIESSPAGKDQRMLILGDLIVDRTALAKVPKLSPEAPVPVAMVTTSNPKESPGGAGLAAAYAAGNELPSIFFTACSEQRADWLASKNIDTYHYPTKDNITKTRYIDEDTGYHLLRVDNDLTVPSPYSNGSAILSIWSKFQSIIELNNIEVVLLLDYRKGFLSNADLVKWIIQLCRQKAIPVYVDSRSEDLSRFRSADILKLNRKEYEAACGSLNVSDHRSLLSVLNLEHLIVTNGSRGADLFNRDGKSVNRIPDLSGYNGTPDVTGCGDVFDVNFCYHWSMNGQSLESALRNAVDKATRFAYEAIEVRLGC